MELGFGGVWGRNPQLPEAIGGLGASPPEARGSGNGSPALGDFLQFFNNNNIFYAYFGQNTIKSV